MLYNISFSEAVVMSGNSNMTFELSQNEGIILLRAPIHSNNNNCVTVLQFSKAPAL